MLAGVWAVGDKSGQVQSRDAYNGTRAPSGSVNSAAKLNKQAERYTSSITTESKRHTVSSGGTASGGDVDVVIA